MRGRFSSLQFAYTQTDEKSSGKKKKKKKKKVTSKSEIVGEAFRVGDGVSVVTL